MHPHVQLSRVYLVSTLVSTLDVTHLIKRERGYKNYDILHNQNSTKHNQVSRYSQISHSLANWPL